MKIKIGSLEMYCHDSNSGDPVLFVHAFPLHGGMWQEQINLLPQRWRFLAPDLRGFGRSAADMEGPLTMETMADDLTDLLDAARVEQATVCGLSMGGYVALALYRRSPERVRALILADTRAGADSEQQQEGRREMAEKVLREGAATAADALIPRLLSDKTRQGRPDLVQSVRAMIEQNPPATISAALEGMAERPDSTSLLPNIQVPTLVMVGADDVLTPPTESEIMAQAIPEAQLRVIPDAGHLANLENPTAFNHEIVQFMEAIQGH